MDQETTGLTRGQLAKAAECPFHIINYLKDLGRLSLMTPQQGSGHYILYHPSCIEIIHDHLAKRRNGPSRD